MLNFLSEFFDMDVTEMIRKEKIIFQAFKLKFLLHMHLNVVIWAGHKLK